jgi:hypothetical protein
LALEPEIDVALQGLVDLLVQEERFHEASELICEVTGVLP